MKTCLFWIFIGVCSVNTVVAQVQLTQSNLPILVITTEGNQEVPNEPKIEAHLGIIWNGDGASNHISDPYNHFNGKIGIEKRGSSSQWFDKKNYALETRNEDGSSLNVSLFGFPQENDWVLHGPYSDKSLMRNALAYILAGRIMEYAPRVKYCEVILNGDYRGVYIFTEKIKRDKGRVDISDLKPEENEGDDLTGGYILKFDKFDGGVSDGFDSQYPPIPGTNGRTVFQYHYPKADEITPAQKSYIQGYINQVEAALKSPDFKDTLLGYRKSFDIESFINFIFIQEISRNVDGYRLSTFMYKDKDSVNGKLKMGPVWDFNLGFSNVDYCIGPGWVGWAWDFNNFCPGDFWVIHFWWKRMQEDPRFLAEMKDKWFALRASELKNDRVIGLVDSLYSLLQAPSQRNFQRWPVLGQYVWPNAYIGGNYTNEINYLRNWLINRLAWMDSAMESIVGVDNPPNNVFSLEVFPNPFKEEVTFKVNSITNKPVRISLFNAQGKLIGVLKKDNVTAGDDAVYWNRPLSNGIYFYKVALAGEQVAAGKLVKIPGQQ